MKYTFELKWYRFFDNEGGDNGDGGGEGGDTGGDTGGSGGDTGGSGEGDGGTTFTQEDLNRVLAEDRRKHQARYKTLEASYEKILQEGNLHKTQREKMVEELEDLQKAFRTKEQQAEYERKQQAKKYQDELTQATESASRWEKMYKSSVIEKSIQDAAASAGAFNTSQIISLVKPMTKMVEDTDAEGRPTGTMSPKVDFPDVDEKTGEQIVTLRTPQEAVKRMKELTDMYGNLFRSNVVSGIGTGSATGGVKPGKSNIDMTKLTPEQYRRVRKENPEALGLRPQK